MSNAFVTHDKGIQTFKITFTVSTGYIRTKFSPLNRILTDESMPQIYHRHVSRRTDPGCFRHLFTQHVQSLTEVYLFIFRIATFNSLIFIV